ncbi:MAG: hypothetical protein HJJLKODD_01648 [Phycisphaerae bacterium]|nr:hypothetical protein [Phycisphaerae bacterium]
MLSRRTRHRLSSLLAGCFLTSSLMGCTEKSVNPDSNLGNDALSQNLPREELVIPDYSAQPPQEFPEETIWFSPYKFGGIFES